MKTIRSRRRGVVLLIVVSLLALFILLGITYSLSVSQYHTGSKIALQHNRVGDPAPIEADLIFGQILYDTATRTALQYHSLLRDLYGDDSIQGTISAISATNNTNNQFWTIQFSSGGTVSTIPNYYSGRVITFRTGRAANHSARVAAYDPQAGVTPAQLTVEAIESRLNGSVSSAIAVGDEFMINGAPFNGAGAGYDAITRNLDAALVHRAAINQAIQNNSALTGVVSGLSENPALLPYYAGYDANNCSIVYDISTPFDTSNVKSPQYVQNSFPYLGNKAKFVGNIGGAGFDESWDAVDFQNMFLAMIHPRAAENPSTYPVIPSYHRPELVNFWYQTVLLPLVQSTGLSQPNDIGVVIAYPYGPDRVRNTNDDNSVNPWSQVPLPLKDRIYNITRGFCFRPMPWDHPNFTGSNPNFAPTVTNSQINPGSLVQQLITNLSQITNVLWDVDNDNDGVPDSIWIDPGLPMITLPDGRRVKRLAAILIKDLDGSINVNAHGNLFQVYSQGYPDPNSGQTVTRYPYLATEQLQRQMINSNYYPLQPPNMSGYSYTIGLATQGQLLPRGSGFGPADVSFLNIFNNNYAAYENVLRGRYASHLQGDKGNTALPGAPNTRDWLSIVKHNGVPNDYGRLGPGPTQAYWVLQPSWYGSPPDVFGRGATVLDVGGPLFAFMGQNNEMLDSPYELALGGEGNNADTPYTVAELERLLRYHDNDAAQLPSRLLNAAAAILATQSPGVIDAAHAKRNMLTTIQSHLPVPAARMPQEMRASTSYSSLPAVGSSTILDLYAAKLTNGGASNINQELQNIVPWEFFKGQKFDLNRWFGDGVDNDANGTRDDAFERNNAPQNSMQINLAQRMTIERAFRGDDNDEDGTPDDVDGNSQPDVPNFGLPNSFKNVAPAHTNGLNSANGFAARQLYARHLFCLAMLFMPDDPGNPAAQFQPNFAYDAAANGNTTAGRQLMIRRLAQWAINCVDFRDPDSVMTPFEFDYNPWDGWGVDGNLTTTNDAAGQDRGVVWGIEAPDLLITETLAFHDRRLKDTAMDNGPKAKVTNMMANPPDPDLDQFRVPEGSLFIELYCPRTRAFTGQQGNNKPALNDARLYPTTGNVTRLNLAALSPPDTANNLPPRPVWRVALTRIDRSGMTTPQAATAALQNPESTSFEPAPASMSMVAGTSQPLTPERFVYFTASPPPGVFTPAEMEVSYFNTNVAAIPPQLEPGQYAVVGPRAKTVLGSLDPTTTGGTSLWGGNSQQMIQLSAPGALATLPANPNVDNGIVVTDSAGQVTSRTVNSDMQLPVSLICNMQVPGWPWPVGLNISEPLYQSAIGPNSYYPPPAPPPSASTGFVYPDFYDDPDSPMGTFKDKALEGLTNPQPASSPIVDNQMQQTGTYTDCSTAFLQRLADPSQPYNAVTNPYITVDWATIDLTVFNGEENATNTLFTEVAESINNAEKLKFRSRQRGFLAQGGMASNGMSLNSNPWPVLTQNDASWKTPLASGTPTYFDVDLKNRLYSAATGATYPMTFDQANDCHTLGSLNSTVDFPATTTSGVQYVGESVLPAPWLTWNNRNFANAMELLCVPASSSGRLGLEMTPDYPMFQAGTANPISPYFDGTNPTLPMNLHSQFGHLLNFFHSSQINTTASNSGGSTTFPYAGSTAANAPHLYRILDYVEVPSPFVGTERWFNPQQFNINNSGGFGLYQAPFNKLSRFRDPGRTNVNTLFDGDQWDALVAQFPGLRTSDNFTTQFGLSRQDNGTNTVYQMNQSTPTLFANPFRSADSADLMPNVGSMRKQFPVQATLLRADPSTTSGTPQPLFVISSNSSNSAISNWLPTTGQTPGRNATPGSPGTAGNALDINRNPYFRYQPLQKVGNLLATNSNCFAIWITIGYFEVEEFRPGFPQNPQIVFDAAHPDGFALGPEVGSDSGEIKRHRAFYIVDRSIPVGFSPGSRLNTDECVLVRRLLE